MGRDLESQLVIGLKLLSFHQILALKICWWFRNIWKCKHENVTNFIIPYFVYVNILKEPSVLSSETFNNTNKSCRSLQNYILHIVRFEKMMSHYKYLYLVGVQNVEYINRENKYLVIENFKLYNHIEICSINKKRTAKHRLKIWLSTFTFSVANEWRKDWSYYNLFGF